jgi:hypothetical protein
MCSPLDDVRSSSTYQSIKQSVRKQERNGNVEAGTIYAKLFRDQKVRRRVASSLIPGSLQEKLPLKIRFEDKHLIFTGSIPAQYDKGPPLALQILLPSPKKMLVVENGLDATFRSVNFPHYQRKQSEALLQTVGGKQPEIMELLDGSCILRIELPRMGVAVIRAESCEYKHELIETLVRLNWETFASQLAV